MSDWIFDTGRMKWKKAPKEPSRYQPIEYPPVIHYPRYRWMGTEGSVLRSLDVYEVGCNCGWVSRDVAIDPAHARRMWGADHMDPEKMTAWHSRLSISTSAVDIINVGARWPRSDLNWLVPFR